jgi:hypothetical protein
MSFGGAAAGVAGTFGGVFIAVGVPYVVLAFGANLGPPVQTALIIGALAIGGLVCLVSAFFGLVMPRRIPGAWTRPEHWQGWARQGRQWQRLHQLKELSEEARRWRDRSGGEPERGGREEDEAPRRRPRSRGRA